MWDIKNKEDSGERYLKITENSQPYPFFSVNLKPFQKVKSSLKNKNLEKNQNYIEFKESVS